MSFKINPEFDMKIKLLLAGFFNEILKEIENLSETDVKKLESGDFTLSLKVVKKNSINNKSAEISEDKVSYVLEELRACNDREKGYELLSSYFKTKKDLENFAKLADVYVMKQDKVERIREKIIEGIVGASLRSTAIQGKEN